MERARRAGRWMAVLIVVGLSVAACADKAAEEGDSGAATVEAVKGSDLSQVTLTEEAAKRIDVETGAVSATSGGEGTQIPYSSVLYDPNGDTWAFVNVKGLTFLRAPITIDHIDGDVAFLAEGPPTGTKIVKVGATQLYGAEIGVGEDE